MSDNNQSSCEIPVLNLIQGIQSGEVDARSLNKDERLQCVEVLFLEGYTIPELAQILNRNERTIKRDLDEIRKKTALSPNAELAKQLIGEMVQIARMRQGRIERLAKAKEASAIERGQLEYLSWKVAREMVEKLQSLGYLPLRPQEIVADIFSHSGNESPIKTFDEIRAIVSEVEVVAQKTGQFDPEIVKEIEHINSELEKAKLSQKASDLLQKANQQNEEKQNAE